MDTEGRREMTDPNNASLDYDDYINSIDEKRRLCPHANLVISEVGLMCRDCGSFSADIVVVGKGD